MSLPRQRGWNRRLFKVLSKPKLSVILYLIVFSILAHTKVVWNRVFCRARKAPNLTSGSSFGSGTLEWGFFITDSDMGDHRIFGDNEVRALVGIQEDTTIFQAVLQREGEEAQN